MTDFKALKAQRQAKTGGAQPAPVIAPAGAESEAVAELSPPEAGPSQSKPTPSEPPKQPGRYAWRLASNQPAVAVSDITRLL